MQVGSDEDVMFGGWCLIGVVLCWTCILWNIERACKVQRDNWRLSWLFVG